ncbi:hypothetical protein NDU88_003738, partial [Pleurodeles waltl]
LNTGDEVTTNPEPTDFYSSVATPFPQGLAALFLPDRTKVPVFLVERMVFSVLLAEWASPATSIKFSLCQRQRGRFSRSPLGGGENTFQERFLSALDSGFVCVFVLSCRLQFFFSVQREPPTDPARSSGHAHLLLQEPSNAALATRSIRKA